MGLLLIFLPSLPPFPACLQHMSPPLVAMETAPHVADRRGKRRGRGGENETEGRGGRGEEWWSSEKRSRGRRMRGREDERKRGREEQRNELREEKKLFTDFMD